MDDNEKAALLSLRRGDSDALPSYSATQDNPLLAYTGPQPAECQHDGLPYPNQHKFGYAYPAPQEVQLHGITMTPPSAHPMVISRDYCLHE